MVHVHQEQIVSVLTVPNRTWLGIGVIVNVTGGFKIDAKNRIWNQPCGPRGATAVGDFILFVVV